MKALSEQTIEIALVLSHLSIGDTAMIDVMNEGTQSHSKLHQRIGRNTVCVIVKDRLEIFATLNLDIRGNDATQ